MPSIDSLVSPTLKHLREHWWDDEFDGFLIEMLRPRPGTRILDVGCGTGDAEVSISRLHVSQTRLFGVDLKANEVATAAHAAAAHNLNAQFAAGDVVRLPFASGAFDSTFCVAVLQHVVDVASAVHEMARVTRVNGRVVAVEPDNSARYAYSSMPSGTKAFALAGQFFAAVAAARGERPEPSVGPRLPGLFAASGMDPVIVRLFPVSHSMLGVPSPETWKTRRDVVARNLEGASSEVQRIGREYLDVLAAYEAEAHASREVFVEIQHTMLFATVGQRHA